MSWAWISGSATFHLLGFRMACKWDENENNVQGKDFKLFSNLNDAFADWSGREEAQVSRWRGNL